MLKRKQPPQSPSTSSPKPRKKRDPYRFATVYDAVASRVNYEGFIQPAFENEHGEIKGRSDKAVPADEVLGRRKHMPESGIPYDEDMEERLPDSDMLIAVHQYASDFYASNGMGPPSYESLDGTALLAVGMFWFPRRGEGFRVAHGPEGVLLEEAVKACIGDSGDLALIDEDVFASPVTRVRSTERDSEGETQDDEQEEEGEESQEKDEREETEEDSW